MRMRYFNFELISAANDWVEQNRANFEKAKKLYWKTVEDYQESLDKLKPRLSKKAWEFFRYGFSQTGLHDANLLSLKAGDAISFEVDAKQPLRLNRRKSVVQIEFLNYAQDLHYIFEARGISRFDCSLFVANNKSFDDLFTYEIMALDDEYLQLGFLFANGATIIIQFRKLIFRKTKIKRNYSINEIYS